jgi:hypothetical protein
MLELTYSPHLFGITVGGDGGGPYAKYTLQALILSGGINIKF